MVTTDRFVDLAEEGYRRRRQDRRISPTNLVARNSPPFTKNVATPYYFALHGVPRTPEELKGTIA